MKDKLLSVYVNYKDDEQEAMEEVYYVKQVEKEADMYGNTKAYAVFDSSDNIIHTYNLGENAFIDAIERGYEGNNGNCKAHYVEEHETLIFEDYKFRLRIRE